MILFLMGDILLDKIKKSDEMKMSLSASWLKKPVVIALIALICGAPVFAMGITNIAQVLATITLSPDSGYGYTIVTISGSDFTGSSAVTIRFAGIPVLSTITRKDGSFVGQFVVPTDQDGVYTVSAVDGKGRKASTSFTVIINPTLDKIKEEVKSIEGKLDQLLKPPLPPLTGEVTIGALLPLTGELATYGENEKAAIELAAEEVNAFLVESGAAWTLKVLVEDTQLKPDIALAKLESFAAMGIKFIVGPLSSGEVRKIKDYANDKKMLVVSHGSTAPDLAIPDDYIFRFCPQDKLGQGPAIARLMYDDGKRYVIPVWRGDFWGDGLEDAVKTRFIELGGTFLDGIRYAPEETDFIDEATTLANAVTSAVDTYGADQVGVLLIAFQEDATLFFSEAKKHDVLWTVNWYGSEGTCLSGALLDPAVADFCAATGFINTCFSPTKSEKYWKVHDELVARLPGGREPDCYAYVAYDIVWALTYSLLSVNRYDSEAVRTVLQSLRFFSFFGASGLIVLDENGDRTHGDYDLWAIVEVEAGVKYEWKLLGTYIHATDSITWVVLFGEIPVGVLLPLTGELATYGENERVAIELAVEEVNAFLAESGAAWTLKVVVEDTACRPEIALEKLESLAAMGIKFIVGPLSSGEVHGIKDYADANKILVVSHGSTAPDLAVPDDFIFRFCAQDPAQGRAIARLVYDDGKGYVIPVWRGDPWGDGLVEKVKTRFEELTGTFLEGVRYGPEETDFSEEAADLATKVSSALEDPDIDETNLAVLHISFEEVNAFMTACLAHDVLDDVEWYGSDGTCLSGAMLEDSSVRVFAAAVNYTCTTFTPTKSDKYWKVHDKLVAELEREPDSYAYVAYDIVWALTHSLFTVNNYDSEAVRAVLPEVTASLFGASGLIVLDENGDRTHGDYDLWRIVEVDTGVYDWKLVGTWLYDTDSITWLP